jgi:protein-L-isoaspartate O-methyltransferase
MASMKQLRKQLVASQVEARGVRDPLVLEAMGKVERELFVPKRLRNAAYADSPLPR